MGGAVSSGENNDALVDNLVEADYIRSPEVERVFRAVDRAFYFTEGHKNSAYKDLAWKQGNLHLSAPCIYSQVMESLELKPGLSFLNLGSGTGYLSTMVGLVLGSKGTNHGVEIHADVITYAEERLSAFVKSSGSLDEYDFCLPQFVRGNCLSLSKSNRKYDRVYCGAACPEIYENFMKQFLKIGGILVVPMNDQLLQIRRLGEDSYDSRAVLPVSFASLITPRPDSLDDIMLPAANPLNLQECCRCKIRSILRSTIDSEQPELWKQCRKNPKQKNTRGLRPCVLPIFEDSDSDNLTFEGHVSSSSESEEETADQTVPNETETRANDSGVSLEPESQQQLTSQADRASPSSEDSRPEDEQFSGEVGSQGNRTSSPDRIQYFTRSLRDERGHAALVIIESRSRRSPRGPKRRSVMRDEECSSADADMSTVCNEKNYTYFMRKKIDALPVPYPLKSFLDYSRGFSPLVETADLPREN